MKTSAITTSLLSLCILFSSLTVTSAKDVKTKRDLTGFTKLFNGKDFTGWEQRGGKAIYTVEEGVVVGTTALKTPNSFMCTKKEYGNFILELDFKVDPAMNSGVQIRSHCFDKETKVIFVYTVDVPRTISVVTPKGTLGKTVIDKVSKTRTKKIPANRVHGYQVEIDPSDRAWTGGIYDESRRGWLNDLKDNKKAGKAFKQNEWNHFKIVANGDSIKTWINGVAAADLKDSMTAKGFIALQVHNTKSKTPLKVMWKNIYIKELAK